MLSKREDDEPTPEDFIEALQLVNEALHRLGGAWQLLPGNVRARLVKESQRIEDLLDRAGALPLPSPPTTRDRRTQTFASSEAGVTPDQVGIARQDTSHKANANDVSCPNLWPWSRAQVIGAADRFSRPTPSARNVQARESRRSSKVVEQVRAIRAV